MRKMVSMPQQPTVPAHAALLRDYVNTLDVETGEEALTSPADVSRWLVEHALVDAGAQADGSDYERALSLRETLRAALIRHHVGTTDGSSEALDAVCADYPVRVTFRDGEPALTPVAEGVHGALARIVAAVVASASDGTWQRLKVCPEETCQWAFLDTSKNRSRTWCSMRVCGNRSKTRSYRARQRETGPTDETDTHSAEGLPH